jgi:hypothetical protein
MNNGVILQKRSNALYQGVDGDNWYLNSIYPELFEDFFDENIDLSWKDDSFVDVCNNQLFLKEYVRLSLEKQIDFRIILCCTEKPAPDGSNMMWSRKHFIGYDYAYAGGSYYSAVFNELHFNRLDEFKNVPLNKNGLVEEEQTLRRYINIRNNLIQNGVELEKGNFIIYKLFEVCY